MLIWTNKKKEKILKRINEAEERSRMEVFKIFDVLNYIDSLDLSEQVKKELWNDLISVSASICLDNLEFKAIRADIEA